MLWQATDCVGEGRLGLAAHGGKVSIRIKESCAEEGQQPAGQPVDDLFGGGVALASRVGGNRIGDQGVQGERDRRDNQCRGCLGPEGQVWG